MRFGTQKRTDSVCRLLKTSALLCAWFNWGLSRVFFARNTFAKRMVKQTFRTCLGEVSENVLIAFCPEALHNYLSIGFSVSVAPSVDAFRLLAGAS